MKYIVTFWEQTETGEVFRTVYRERPQKTVEKLLTENLKRDITIRPCDERIYAYPCLLYNGFTQTWHFYFERYCGENSSYKDGMQRMKKRMDMGMGILLKY